MIPQPSVDHDLRTVSYLPWDLVSGVETRLKDLGSIFLTRCRLEYHVHMLQAQACRVAVQIWVLLRPLSLAVRHKLSLICSETR